MQHEKKIFREWTKKQLQTSFESENTKLPDLGSSNLIGIDRSNEVENGVDENITERDHETVGFEEEHVDGIKTMKREIAEESESESRFY